MKERKQNDATYPLVFLLVSSTDHTASVAGVAPAVTLSKNGGAFAACAGTVSEVGNGWYKVAGAGMATDTNTPGPLVLHATAAGADPSDTIYTVVPWDPFDAVRMGMTALPNANANANGGLPILSSGGGSLAYAVGAAASVTAAVTLPAIPANWITAAGINPAALNGKGDWNTTAPPTASAVASAVWTDTTAGDFAASGSPGKVIAAQLAGAFTTASSSVFAAAALANAPSASDPWAVAVPGPYAAGTAGSVLGTNLNAPVSGAVTVAPVSVSAIRDGLASAAALTAVSNAVASVLNTVDALPDGPAAAAALLDLADGVETGLTVRQWLRLAGAVLAGVSVDTPAGAGGSTAFKRRDGTTVAVTVDRDGAGSRTSVTPGNLS